MLFSSPSWIVSPVILPLMAALLCFLLPRGRFGIALTSSLSNCAAAAVLTGNLLISGPLRYRLGGWPAPLGITLCLDGPAMVMLLMTSITGLGITLYARGYFSSRISVQTKRIQEHQRQEKYFFPLWMMLLAGLNAMFLSADIFNIYVTLELVSVSAAALAALSGKPASQIAAFRYLLVSLLGSLSYLLGVVIIYKTHGVLDLNLLRQMTTPNVQMWAALALISTGLLLKTALFPLHFWLPPAHANALAPVSAILSGLVVKGSFFLVFRFWFDVLPMLTSRAALNLIGMFGSAAIIWGAIQAIRQQRLKLLIAYSTVSQLGYLFVAFPLSHKGTETMVWGAVAFMALSHACAKSAMFMAAGSIFLHLGHDRINSLAGVRSYLPVSTFAYAIAGVSLMGLPPSGGFISKWILLMEALASSQWWWGLIIMTGSLLATVYVFRVISQLFVVPAGQTAKTAPVGSHLLQWPGFALACLSLLLGILAPFLLRILAIDNLAYATVAGGLP